MTLNEKYKIGIVGYGFLGESVAHVFNLHADIKINDKYKEGFHTLEDTVAHGDFVFLCLPTPMYKDNGEIDLRILEEVLERINSMLGFYNDKIIIIKSTVVPGTTDSFIKKYPNLNIIHIPEFLTARAHLINSITPARIILGGSSILTDIVEALYRSRFGNAVNIYKTSSNAAEMTKYVANNFFMLKVVYANIIFKACEKLEINYDEVKDMVLADGRIGISHMDVPGHDGKFFAGGVCFPKDINAFIFKLNELGVDAGLLKEAWRLNLEGRPERDWEQLPGAVSER